MVNFYKSMKALELNQIIVCYSDLWLDIGSKYGYH